MPRAAIRNSDAVKETSPMKRGLKADAQLLQLTAQLR